MTSAAKSKLLHDPSSDNYNYYRDDDSDILQHDIVRRYKYYNGTEGTRQRLKYRIQLMMINTQQEERKLRILKI